MHRDPGNRARATRHFPDVQAGSDLQPGSPHFIADVPGAANGARWAVERREESVSGRVDELAPVQSERSSNRLLEAIEHDTPAAVADIAEVPGRTDDVDEEHG